MSYERTYVRLIAFTMSPSRILRGSLFPDLRPIIKTQATTKRRGRPAKDVHETISAHTSWVDFCVQAKRPLKAGRSHNSLQSALVADSLSLPLVPLVPVLALSLLEDSLLNGLVFCLYPLLNIPLCLVSFERSLCICHR